MAISGMFSFAWRLALLTILTFAYFSMAGLLAGLAQAPPPPGQAPALTPVLLSCFMISCVCSYWILRSRLTGRRLILAIAVAFWGVGFVLTQIEALVFITARVPPLMILRVILMGAILAVLFTPTAVAIFGRLRTADKATNRSPMPVSGWPWKLSAISAVYLVLYFGFGYFVAWKDPAVLAYYQGVDPGSFLLQLRAVWTATPWLFPFQILRALLFVVFSLMLIRVARRGRTETALALGVFFAVWSSLLLVPNPFMPSAVAHAHLIETLWSNLLFGIFVGGLLTENS